MALNATNVRVTWDIPDSVSSQGLNAYSVALIPECFSGAPRGGAQQFNGDPAAVTMADFGNLGEYMAECKL